jgi:hypothetical protein
MLLESERLQLGEGFVTQEDPRVRPASNGQPGAGVKGLAHNLLMNDREQEEWLS